MTPPGLSLGMIGCSRIWTVPKQTRFNSVVLARLRLLRLLCSGGGGGVGKLLDRCGALLLDSRSFFTLQGVLLEACILALESSDIAFTSLQGCVLWGLVENGLSGGGSSRRALRIYDSMTSLERFP